MSGIIRGMGSLIAASLCWIGLHVGVAGTRLRDAVVRHTGEPGFRGLFSLLSLLLIVWLIRAYERAGTATLWIAPRWLRALLVIAMLVAFVLFAGALLVRNPTGVGGEGALAREPRGMLRVTRHPMLWSFALWALAHILGEGDTASLLFFGAFLVTALAGMPSIDAKLARRHPAAWQTLAERTSVMPFGAVATGRNRLAPGELVIPGLVGIALWAALLALHRRLFGVSPLPV